MSKPYTLMVCMVCYASSCFPRERRKPSIAFLHCSNNFIYLWKIVLQPWLRTLGSDKCSLACCVSLMCPSTDDERWWKQKCVHVYHYTALLTPVKSSIMSAVRFITSQLCALSYSQQKRTCWNFHSDLCEQRGSSNFHLVNVTICFWYCRCDLRTWESTGLFGEAKAMKRITA